MHTHTHTHTPSRIPPVQRWPTATCNEGRFRDRECKNRPLHHNHLHLFVPLARRGKTGLVGSQPSAYAGAPNGKSETFYGGSPEKVGPTNQTRRREGESSEPAPRARRATRGGRSGRLEDGLRRVRGHIIDEPRIQWLTIVMEAKYMRADWSTRPSRRRSGRRQTSSLCNRRSTHVQTFKKLVVVVDLEVVGDCGRSCRLSSTPRSDRSPGDRSWA